MQFSRSLKSSSQSQPSPNGAFIATIFSAKLTLRSTRSLEITRTIVLPAEFTASLSWFLWSDSSTRLLLANKEEIRVYSAADAHFFAHIKNPTSGNTKVVLVKFGSDDNEICVFAEYGLKLSIIDLITSKSVDINSPKLFTPATASKGFRYRPQSGNLALLTRNGGKDVISLHSKESFEVTRSWCSDTIDAQGISWSPDGRWLVVWESPAHGHRALVYTADGHLFRTWNGSIQSTRDVHLSLGAGIKLYDWSDTSNLIAIGDFSARVTVVNAPALAEVVSLKHSGSVSPDDALQIWQEQVIPSNEGTFSREFILAVQTLFLPTSEPASSNPEPKSGVNILSFDQSGTLLATRTESMPTVLWIWDITTRSLRTVLIFHASIVKVSWHPSINELLLVRCEGEDNRSLMHLWDPSWPNPRIVDFATQLVGGKALGKTFARWLNVESTSPAIYFSDSQDCILASLADEAVEAGQEAAVPWTSAVAREYDVYGQREESPLNLVPATRRSNGISDGDNNDHEQDSSRISEGSEDVDDTFSFRKFANPSSQGHLVKRKS